MVLARTFLSPTTRKMVTRENKKLLGYDFSREVRFSGGVFYIHHGGTNDRLKGVNVEVIYFLVFCVGACLFSEQIYKFILVIVY